jgi:hypothetical protein
MTATARPARSGSRRGAAWRSGRRRRAVAVLEIGTGVLAVAGGVLLAIEPDGSLLQADPAALTGSPFTDWRLPGVLLSMLVGGGFLVVGWWQWRDGPRARALSMAAGAGLVLFEAFELAWIGFQPLEAVFAAVGLTVLVLAATSPAAPRRRASAAP